MYNKLPRATVLEGNQKRLSIYTLPCLFSLSPAPIQNESQIEQLSRSWSWKTSGSVISATKKAIVKM